MGIFLAYVAPRSVQPTLNFKMTSIPTSGTPVHGSELGTFLLCCLIRPQVFQLIQVHPLTDSGSEGSPSSYGSLLQVVQIHQC